MLNAANLGIRQQFFDVSIDDFMNVINTNIGWNFMLSREAAIQMKKKRWRFYCVCKFKHRLTVQSPTELHTVHQNPEHLV